MPLRNPGRMVDAGAGLVIALVAGAGFIAVPHLVSGWAFAIPGTTDSAMAPTFFPRLALATTATFGVLVALTAPLRSDPLPVMAMRRTGWLRIATLLAISIGYLAALPLFGFILSSTALMLLLPLMVGYRRPIPLVATALLLPPVVSYVFWYGLKVALPAAHIAPFFARP
jgi:hypothetical protein